MPRNLTHSQGWMETPLRSRAAQASHKKKWSRNPYHVDDYLLPSAYSKIGQEILNAKYASTVTPHHQNTYFRDEYRIFGAPRPSIQSSLVESIPRHFHHHHHPNQGIPCAACCRRAYEDCREAWSHTHTHIDPWEIEVVSTSTAHTSSDEAGSPKTPSPKLEALNENHLFTAPSEASPDFADDIHGEDLPSATLCSQTMPTPLIRSIPLVGSAAPTMNVIMSQVFGPLIEFCSGKGPASAPRPSPSRPQMGSSDPFEGLTTNSPASTSTTHSGRSRWKRSPHTAKDRSQSVPRIRNATPPPSRNRTPPPPAALSRTSSLMTPQPKTAHPRTLPRPRKRGPHHCGEEVLRPSMSESDGVLTEERIPEMKVLPTSYDISSNLSSGRQSEFERVTEAVCVGNSRFLRHTSRAAWPMRDLRGRRTTERVR